MRARARDRPGPFPIAPILEAEFGAENVPRVSGSGHGKKFLCPFHPERSPSASVSEFGFTCFGCGVTGDAIKLLMQEGGMSFADSVERCEEITGVKGERVSRADSWSGDLLSGD